MRANRVVGIPGVAAWCLIAALSAPASAGAASPWVAPLDGPPRVVRAFQPPAERWLHGHRGVDLAGRPAARVGAAGPGRVSFAGRLAGRGVVVVVHGALRTTYEPLQPSVRVGDEVVAGTPIGRLGPGHQPGRPAAAVLHWGLIRGQTYLDPMSLLGGRPVRLLPHWRGPPALVPPAAGGASIAVAVDSTTALARSTRPGRSGPPAATAAVAVLAAMGVAAVLARAGPAP